MEEDNENQSPFSSRPSPAASTTTTTTTTTPSAVSPLASTSSSSSSNSSAISDWVSKSANSTSAISNTNPLGRSGTITTTTTSSARANGASSSPSESGSSSNTPVSKASTAPKRSRLGGAPANTPNSYSPLGATSPSMSSNGPSYSPATGAAPAASGGQPAGTPSTPNPNSAASTPLATPTASPSQSHAALPPSSMGNSAAQQQQQFHNHAPSNVSPSPYAPHQSSLQQHPQAQPHPGPTGSGGYGGPSSSSLAPTPGSASATTNTHLYPALHLHPLNDTFIPKQISLYPPGPHNRIKIGRQTNAKTVPAPNNGYFDSKVLSRTHAEVWCEGNKVYIKDVKSSNGTFINGERLSPEAVESDIFELHNNDMVEFGIDITSEDQKTIVHHKVAARCFLVMNAEDAVATTRNLGNYYREMTESPMHRRAGMGGAKSAMAHAGMNLDQVLNRLQTELQKSRETGADLGTLTSAIGEIHETLGGNVPGPPLPAYRVPPYVAPNPNAPPSPQQIAQQSQAATQQLLQTLQTQLQETQNALHGHVERIRSLEGLLSEQERMKAELAEVKERMEEAKTEWSRLKEGNSVKASSNGLPRDAFNEALNNDDDDDEGDDDEKDGFEDADEETETRTIRLDDGLDDLTTSDPVPGEPGRGDSHPAAGAKRHTASGAAAAAGAGAVGAAALAASQARLEAENAALAKRMEDLSNELSVASQLSSSLKSQYVQAAETIRSLEEKVSSMEQELHQQKSIESKGMNDATGAPRPTQQATTQTPETKINGPPGPVPTVLPKPEDIIKEVENRFTDWKKSFEAAAKKDREDWEAERERLRVAVQEWERKSTLLEEASLSQRAASSSAINPRRKRRSKASTVGSSSEETSESDEADDVSSKTDEGFASPVTDDSHSPPSTRKVDEGQAEEANGDVLKSLPKRPRSRRRRRGQDRAPPLSPSAGSTLGAELDAAHSSARSTLEEGGSPLLRRRSWIPFSSNPDGTQGPAGVAGMPSSPSPTSPQSTSPHPTHKRKAPRTADAGILDHPAFPIVSAASVVVLGYLAYNAVVQHQK